ncbi:hypothetical protein [Poseidonibacter antarcticus]|uniref:hypothetical protein n=1 Tax=Poseidonibacter antarcticus TaxID=2478538 RepID=UPI000EF479AA|nr:hypothetical protein [Poseidonibacter antarcticus]
MKKPKIAVIGIGSTGVSLIDNLTKTNTSDIEYISFAQKNINDRLSDNEKVKTIDTSRSERISLEKAKEYCLEYNKTKRLEEMLSLMQLHDSLYGIIPLSESSIQTIGVKEIKLKRCDETIDKFKL